MRKPNRLCSRGVEFRASEANEGDGRTLEGYAAVFRSPTRINGWEGEFDEEIARGAFSKTLSERMPVLQFDHGRDVRTGSVPIGAIEDIREDGKGLFVRARLYDNQVVEPIRQAIEGGSIDGMSFRFKVVRDEWRDKDGTRIRDNELPELLYGAPHDRGPLKRTIREVELYEAGPVVFPAYESTSVGVRSLLTNLGDEERADLIRELAAEIRGMESDADPGVTSDDEPDAGHETTSGYSDGERAAMLRELTLKGVEQ